MINKETTKIGFIGLGVMGFSMCHGLYKSGWKIVLPTYRREIDQSGSFTPLVPDKAAKIAVFDEMLENGCEASESPAEQFAKSDVIMISMPTSVQVEMNVYGEQGILENARPGTIVIDLTSSDPASTRKISADAEKKGIEYMDCPISGGYQGAIAQTLSVMGGGKKEIYEEILPILHTIGKPEKVVYMGPSGAGDAMKCANNFLSGCCLMATTEALSVLYKAGISPDLAAQVITASGGCSSASSFKFPEILFPDRPMGMSINMILKDVALFNKAAKETNVPNYFGSLAYQVLGMPAFEGKGNVDWGEAVKQYEKWCDVKLTGITGDQTKK